MYEIYVFFLYSILPSNRLNHEVEIPFDKKRLQMAKSFDLCQSAQTVPADMSRYLLHKHQISFITEYLSNTLITIKKNTIFIFIYESYLDT